MKHQLAATLLGLTAQYFEAMAQAVSEAKSTPTPEGCQHPNREPLGMGGRNWRCEDCGHIEQPEV